MPSQFILASASPIRLSELRSAGYQPQVEPARVDEVLPANAQPQDIAIALAQAKAREVQSRFPGHFVLGSDQVMFFADKAVAKAYTRQNARRRLMSMRGRWHSFYPAACLLGPSGFEQIAADEVHVLFRHYDADFVENYLDSGEWRGCVGSYQIENLGANLVQRVEGDLHAVLGMPFFAVLDMLRDAKIFAETQKK